MVAPHPNSPDAIGLRLLEVKAYQRHAPTRMPFCFGAATMTSLTVVYLRLKIEAAGKPTYGVSASVLSPMWFEKDPARSLEERTQNLLTSMSLAARLYCEAGPANAYGLHQAVQTEVHDRCQALGIPALTASFGPALVDSAVIDGLCRLTGTTFHQALSNDILGFGPVPGLPDQPLSHLLLRHTIGLADPLTADDVETALGDGLPETLEEVVREYGVSYLKVKIQSDIAANLERLRCIDEVLQQELAHGLGQGDYRMVLDGNEQFPDMAAFVEFFDALRAEPGLQELYRRLLWFEQPVEREAALDASVANDLRHVTTQKPVILDESDGTDDTVEQALALGYGGVSAKNCKGVFRTLHSQRVLAQWQEVHGGSPILAAEDLTSPAGLALHQDTAVVAALGITHAERNGHHYVRGLDHLSPQEQEAAIQDFPSLYERRPDGLLRLRIKDGMISTGEVNERGYGTCADVDPSVLEALALPEPPS